MAVKRQIKPKRKPTKAPGRPRSMRTPPKKGSARLKGSFIGLRIEDDLKTRLELLGDQEGKSTSDMLKDLIKKYVETKEALDLDADDDDGEEGLDLEEENFDSSTGKALAVRGAARPHVLKARAVPARGAGRKGAEQVDFETLLDDLLRYQGRLKELNDLMKVEKTGFFGSTPQHLKVAKTVCEKKLKLITEQMNALFPDMPTEDGEEEEERSEFNTVL